MVEDEGENRLNDVPACRGNQRTTIQRRYRQRLEARIRTQASGNCPGKSPQEKVDLLFRHYAKSAQFGERRFPAQEQPEIGDLVERRRRRAARRPVGAAGVGSQGARQRPPQEYRREPRGDQQRAGETRPGEKLRTGQGHHETLRQIGGEGRWRDPELAGIDQDIDAVRLCQLRNAAGAGRDQAGLRLIDQGQEHAPAGLRRLRHPLAELRVQRRRLAQAAIVQAQGHGNDFERTAASYRPPFRDAPAQRRQGAEVAPGQSLRHAAAGFRRVDHDRERRRTFRPAGQLGGDKVQIGARWGKHDLDAGALRNRAQGQ